MDPRNGLLVPQSNILSAKRHIRAVNDKGQTEEGSNVGTQAVRLAFGIKTVKCKQKENIYSLNLFKYL